MKALWIQVPAVLTLAIVCLTAEHWIVGFAAISALILSDLASYDQARLSRLVAVVIVLAAFVLLGHGHWILGLLALVALLFAPQPPQPTGNPHDRLDP